MSARGLLALVTLGSVALLIGAFAFQVFGGLAPCQLCLWQRWPHAIAVVFGSLALATKWRMWSYAGAGAVLAGAGIGGFHVGVEQGWWQGPLACTSGNISGLSPDELMSQIMTAPLVRCDEIAWSLAGLSMAGWNAALSLGLFALWCAAFHAQSQPAQRF